MTVVRSLVMDDSGKVWVGGNGNFGYLAPDSKGSAYYVSMVDKIDPKDRNFTDVWQIAITPEGNHFRSYGELLRWDGERSTLGMRTVRPPSRHLPGLGTTLIPRRRA